GTSISKGVAMKIALASMGAMLFVGLAASFAADYPPCPPQPASTPGCTPMPCPNPCSDPCASLDPCKPSCNPFKKWFHHGSKGSEGIPIGPRLGGWHGNNDPGCPGAGPGGNNGGPGAINSPVFPVHPFARSPRDFYMID